MQVYRYLEVGSCHWSYWDLPCWHAQAVILHKAAFGAQLASGFHSHFAPANLLQTLTSPSIMWVKQCHKPPMWEWFIPPILFQ